MWQRELKIVFNRDENQISLLNVFNDLYKVILIVYFAFYFKS